MILIIFELNNLIIINIQFENNNLAWIFITSDWILSVRNLLKDRVFEMKIWKKTHVI